MNEKYIMEVGANARKEFLEKNLVKKGENEMDVMNAIKTIEEEEYIWVKGFKGTDKDMSCKGYQYKLGKQFNLDEDVEPSVCHNGFHFCKELINVFKHYKIGAGNRFFEVEALVRKSDLEQKPKKNYITGGYMPWSSTYPVSEDKYAAKSIRFIRELTPDEVFDAFCDDSDVCKWDEAQKKRAMETSIGTVRNEIRAFELCTAGYSPAFAKYISSNAGRYTTAMAVASLPDVSMDVKVMTIFMDNDN